jgi:hypothetical protein
MPQRPSDVIDEHILFPEEDSGPQDAAGNPKAYERLLQLSLAPEIREIRVEVGIGDADVNNAPDACVPGCAEHDLCVRDRLIVREEPVIETDPVGIDERVHPAQTLGQLAGVIKAERVGDHGFAERVLPLDGVGQRHDAVPGLEKPLGDVAS